MDTLCLFHDSEEEYGILRWPLIDIASAAGAPIKLMRELVDKLVLKGSDHHCEGYIYTPRHGGKDGEPVTLIAANPGPCWYSSRMVRDEYVRSHSGGKTRFQSGQPPPSRRQGEPSPARQGDDGGSEPSQRQGMGASFASALDTPRFNNTTVAAVDNFKTNGHECPEKQTSARWHESEQGIVAKGKALGIEARKGESMRAYKGRIFEALANGGDHA